MPNFDGYTYLSRDAQIREAEKQVKAKFPSIIVGSSGWFRAVDNRLRRIH